MRAHAQFLRGIGYLTADPGEFRIDTRNVDPEIALVAGPQLVVPVDNARYALNAANARWVSLYDALYGTDAILPVDHGAKGYDAARGARVIAYARALLDEIAPLQSGSHADSVGYSIADSQLQVHLQAGTATGLRDPSRYIAWRGTPARPTAVLLQEQWPARGDLHRPRASHRQHRRGGRGGPARRGRHHHHPGLRGLGRSRGCARQGRRVPQLAGPDARHLEAQFAKGGGTVVRSSTRIAATRTARQRTHAARPQPDAGTQCRPPHAHRRA